MFIEMHFDFDPNHVLQCFTASHTKQACIEQKKKRKILTNMSFTFNRRGFKKRTAVIFKV